MNLRHLYPALLLSALALAGCNVNKNIDVPAHAHLSTGSSTVNGEITVAEGAVVDGGLRTINGAIHLGAGAQAGNLTIVNGPIVLGDGAQARKLQGVNSVVTLGRNALVGANVSIVNGGLHAAAGTRVNGSVTVVNGDVALCNAHVGDELDFVNGTVWLGENSSVQGDLIAKKPQGGDHNPEPAVVIGPHATVGGSIVFERAGQLYVSDSATIHAIQGATAVKFSGAAPTGVSLPKCPDD